MLPVQIAARGVAGLMLKTTLEELTVAGIEAADGCNGSSVKVGQTVGFSLEVVHVDSRWLYNTHTMAILTCETLSYENIGNGTEFYQQTRSSKHGQGFQWCK